MLISVIWTRYVIVCKELAACSTEPAAFKGGVGNVVACCYAFDVSDQGTAEDHELLS